MDITKQWRGEPAKQKGSACCCGQVDLENGGFGPFDRDMINAEGLPKIEGSKRGRQAGGARAELDAKES